MLSEHADKKTPGIVVRLTELELKDRGKIAYLQTKDASKMQKLMSMGIVPGLSLQLLQKFPSYVIAVTHSQFAIDKELASSVYVRLTK